MSCDMGAAPAPEADCYHPSGPSFPGPSNGICVSGHLYPSAASFLTTPSHLLTASMLIPSSSWLSWWFSAFTPDSTLGWEPPEGGTRQPCSPLHLHPGTGLREALSDIWEKAQRGQATSRWLNRPWEPGSILPRSISCLCLPLILSPHSSLQISKRKSDFF